jgi:hypothetical protein
MRAMSILIAFLIVAPDIASAQEVSPVGSSERYRLTAICAGRDGGAQPCGRVSGHLLRLGSDTLGMTDRDGRLIGAWPRTQITALQVRVPRPWNPRRGLLLGGIGAASGAAIGFAAGHGTPDRGTYTALGGLGGGLIGFLAGSRPSAWKGFLIGAAASGVAGALAASGCSECPWPTLIPIGAIGGGIVGGLLPAGRWEDRPIR